MNNPVMTVSDIMKLSDDLKRTSQETRHITIMVVDGISYCVPQNLKNSDMAKLMQHEEVMA